MRNNEPIWIQWVVDWEGNTIWSFESPPRTDVTGPDPVALPDADTYPSNTMYLPRFMVHPVAGYEGLPGDMLPQMEYIVMVKARTLGGRIWVEQRRYRDIMRAFNDRYHQSRVQK